MTKNLNQQEELTLGAFLAFFLTLYAVRKKHPKINGSVLKKDAIFGALSEAQFALLTYLYQRSIKTLWSQAKEFCSLDDLKDLVERGLLSGEKEALKENLCWITPKGRELIESLAVGFLAQTRQVDKVFNYTEFYKKD